MNQELELELTFLAKELPTGIKETKPTRIVDVYIPDTPGHSHLRLRQKGDRYEITKKTPSIALADVAQEEFAAGGVLAGKSYDDLESELSRFSYQKIIFNEY